MGMRTRSLSLLLGAALASAASVHSAPPDTRVLRSWQEPVTKGETVVLHRVEAVFDYRQGQAFERVLAPDGTVLELRPMQRVPTPSEPEIADAVAIVRGDTGFQRLIDGRDALLEGGFVLAEPSGEPCGPPARCLQIFAFDDAEGVTLGRAVVDISGGAVVRIDDFSEGGLP